MPIQIKELIIRATIENPESNDNDSSNQVENRARTINKNEEERIIRKCVDQVMDILRINQEP